MIFVNPKAVIDDLQKKVIDRIVPHTDGHLLLVTRGHSSPMDQLRNIEEYGRRNNCLFSEFVHEDLHSQVEIWIEGQPRKVWRWQQTWSTLLHLFWMSKGLRGAKINPPFSAEQLFDYFADGRNKKGEIISPSPHIKELTDPKPCPIDFSQRVDGTIVNGEMQGGTPDIHLVSVIMEAAKSAGAGIRNITVEPANGCVHLDLSA